MTRKISGSPLRLVMRALHGRMVFGRRVSVLASVIADLLPDGAVVLDVGCGNGDIASAIQAKKKGRVDIQGVDVLVRPQTSIPVQQFNGSRLPFGDDAFDYALLIDVLHHTDDPAALLAEVGRVSRRIIVKDHFRNGLFAGTRLKFMDWIGNAPHGVRLPYNYLSRREWSRLWEKLDLKVEKSSENLGLYPFPADWVFGRGLHFVTRLSTS